MKSSNTRVRRDSSKKAAIPQAPNKPAATPPENSAPAEEIKGVGQVRWFNPGMGMGFITNAPEKDVLFTAGALAFDPYRLNAGDKVSFVAKREENGPVATSVEVEEPLAEDRGPRPSQPKSVMLSCHTLEGIAIGGYTMSAETWNRLENGAVKLWDPQEDDRGCIAGFIEDAIREKIERPERGGVQSAPPDQLGSSGDLEAAIDQAEGLNQLLEDRVLNPNDGGSFTGDIKNGIVLLGIATFERLRAASGAVIKAARAKGGAR